IDTAGLRETQDEVERIGIARTWSEAEKADVVLHLLDARSAAPAAERDAVQSSEAAHADPPEPAKAIENELERRLKRDVPVLRVFNKIDLSGDSARALNAEDGEPARA